MIDLTEVLGFCAGACTTFSFVPQIKKVWLTKSVKDISMYMYLIYSTGLLLWLIYSFLINSLSLIFANAITLIFALSILCMKVCWSKKSFD